MRLIVTTVIRHAKLGEQITGRVLEVAWPGGEILHELPTPTPIHPSSNSNPRGGVRGGRGVAVRNDHYYVANYDTVFVYERDWRLVGQISHGLATDIHEIDLDDDGVWITCSGYDLIAKLSDDGKLLDTWQISDSPELARKLGVPVAALDYGIDHRRRLPSGMDHTHLNSVQVLDGNSVSLGLGRVIPTGFRSRVARRLIPMRDPSRASAQRKRLLSLLRGTRSCVVKLELNSRQAPEILACCSTLRPSHNGGLLVDGSVVLLHESCELRVWDGVNRSLKTRTRIPANWVRGLSVVGEGRVLVGTGPCGVVEVDWPRGRVVRSLSLSNHPNESVHGLQVVEDR